MKWVLAALWAVLVFFVVHALVVAEQWALVVVAAFVGLLGGFLIGVIDE